MNIFILGSPWHAIVARAIIETNSLKNSVFILEALSDASLEQIQSILNGYGIYKVFSHEKTRFLSIKKGGVFSFIGTMRSYFVEIGCSAKALIRNVDKKDNIRVYYFNFYSPITRRFLMELKFSEKIVFSRVEDGVCDYFSFNFMNYGRLQRFAKTALAFSTGKYGLYSRNCRWLFNRTSEYFLFFPEKINTSWAGKELKSLLGVNETIRKICASEANGKELFIEGSSSSVLLLGQTLYEDGICSLATELKAYAALLKVCKGRVYFKPHPRSSKEKLDALFDLGFLIINTDLTAECLMSTYSFNSVVGMWSNSIIYSRKIFCMPSYSLVGLLLSYKEYENLSHLHEIDSVLKNKFLEDYCECRLEEFC